MATSRRIAAHSRQFWQNRPGFGHISEIGSERDLNVALIPAKL
jgi:hypothetical protein